MSLEEIALVAEIVGAVAVIATLFYLAVQIRQNSRVVRSDFREKRTSSAQTMLLKLADEADLFQKIGSGDELSETEQLRVDLLLRASYRGWESSVHHYKNGFLDEDEFLGFRASIRQFTQNKFHRDFWNKHQNEFSHGLRELLRDIEHESAT
jgi:hypothetical protein